MPSIDLVDETFVAADPARVVAVVADPTSWLRWWPDLELTVFMDRGSQGLRWNVRGALHGSSEIWVEPVGDGAVLHYYLRAEPAAGPLPDTVPGRRAADRARRSRAVRWKRHTWELKDLLEGARRPGTPAAR